MPQNFELRIPNNGMNTDDDARLIENSESRFILNLRSGSSEDDNVGSIENIKGTTEIKFDLPTGVNTCVGSYGDQTTHSNFFFIYNSLGFHSIYRYLPETRTVRLLAQDPVFKFQKESLINDINVIDNLLYWNDGVNPQRKINFDKADSEFPDFIQCFNFYLGKNYISKDNNQGSTRTIQVTKREKKYSPIVVDETFEINLDESLLENRKELAESVASQINAITSINGRPINLSANACGEFVEIKAEKNVFYSLYAIDSAGLQTAQIVPQNHYQNYIERTIDVIKHPPHCNLTASIETNDDFKRNFIKNKVFQFAARYIYDDNEKTVVSPYSPNIYNKYTCAQYIDDDIANYIKINLSVFPELFNLSDLQTIKRLELFVKEGELGDWRSITQLEQYEFVDTKEITFDFYNNFVYTPIDQTSFVRPYHTVPILSKTQESVKNRIFYGNNLEQYDPTCINADIDVEYDDVESKVKAPTNSVSGIIMIRAAFNGTVPDGDSNTRSCAKSQAIRKDGNGGGVLGGSTGGTANAVTVWGGISEGAGNDPEVFDMAEKTGQILPLDGFTVYLAGTDFYDISNQNIGRSHDNVTQNSKGVYQNISKSDMYQLVNKVRENMRESFTTELDLNKWREKQDYSFNKGGADDPTQAYSTFEIKNVPDGWYILRVASHKTTEEDLKDQNRGYQRTSTNVNKIQNLDAVENPSSVFNIQSAIEGVSELLINVRNGEIPRIKIEITDISHASDGGSSKICTGYLVDSDIENPVNTFEGFLQDTRISRAAITFDEAPTGDIISSGSNGTNKNTNRWRTSAPNRRGNWKANTDANGYYWYASIKSGKKLDLKGAYGDFSPSAEYWGGSIIEERGFNTTAIDEDEYREVVIKSPKGASFDQRALIIGKTVDNLGVGIPKSSVVSIRGEVAISDNSGNYQFWHYSIKQSSAGNPSLDTYLIANRTSNSCSPIYDENQIYNFNFSFDAWFNGGFSPAPPNQVSPVGTPRTILKLDIPDFIGDVSNIATINSFKRSWDGKFGIVYFDRGLRSSAVNSDSSLNIHIPFYTELDVDGQQKIGLPVLNWEVKNLPPKWATHWQWVRTRNETVGSYFQWGIKTVEYKNSAGDNASYNSAVRVKVFIDNLTRYKGINPTMDLQTDIDTETWRIRFIKDSSENYFNLPEKLEYNDYKIIEYDESELSIEFEKNFDLPEILPGTLVEIYNEKLDIEEEIFFEFAECFEVGTDINGNKFHKGLNQDQDPIDPQGVPAKGTFRTGDAYYRLRSIPSVTSNTPAYIDDDAVSDFYPSEVESIGRANGINPDFFQKWKPNQIRHGGKYIPDSNVNDLSVFVASNFQPLPISYGDIYKLQLASNVLLSIHEFRWVSNYIEEGIIRKQTGDNEIVASTKVFDSYRAAKPITGTINPESVKEFRGKVYAVDINKGLVNQYDANGLTAISAYKKVDFFSDFSKKILNLMNKGNERPRILGFIDHKRDEYIISVNDIYTQGDATELTPIDPSEFKTSAVVNKSLRINSAGDNTLFSLKALDSINNVVFDKSKTPNLKKVQVDNKTSSEGLLNVKVIETNGEIRNLTTLQPGQGVFDLDLETETFTSKRGTEDNVIAANPTESDNILFEGFTIAYNNRFNKWTTFYSFRPEMFGNVDLEMLGFTNGKLWVHNDSETRNNFYGVQYSSILETIFNNLPNQVKVFEAVGADSYYAWTVPSAKTKNGMETEIVAERFVRREDSFYAPVMRDKNDPSKTNPQDAIINGRQLRDRTIRVAFENESTNEVVLFSVSMLSTISTRHGK